MSCHCPMPGQLLRGLSLAALSEQYGCQRGQGNLNVGFKDWYLKSKLDRTVLLLRVHFSKSVRLTSQTDR